MTDGGSDSGSGGKMVKLRISNGQEFEVRADTIAAASSTIRDMLEDDCVTGGIPLPIVSGPILARVIEFCNRHYADAVPDAAAEDPILSVGGGDGDPDLARFDAAFIGGVDQDRLFDLMLATNYLDVQKLLDLACKTVADQMRGKTRAG